ncbi:MAG: tRNA dihydrouridine synthase DusB [Hyphomicrobiales bacterium]
MRIGDIEVTGTARLAPMAGVSNAPFRLIARECGSGLTTSEEIDAISLIRESPVALEIARYYPEERPLAMQLLGCDPDLLVAAAEMLQEAGADIIDLNMGCPMPKITKQGKGAALMRDLQATAQLLTRMRKAIRVPFTVKIRGGWDNQHLNAVEVARMAEDCGVDAIVVHPRTQSQRYTGKAPWEIIADVVDAVSIPVTGNGDVTSMAEARAMIEQTGCQSVMIGRGALGRPWVFDETFEQLSPAEQWAYRRRVIARHVALIREQFADNERYALNQLRKQLGWYVEGGLPGCNQARAAVHQARSQDGALAGFWRWFDRVQEGLRAGDREMAIA